MNKSKMVAPLLTTLLLGTTGCVTAEPPMRPGTALNEVLTLTEVAIGKMLITLRVEDGMNAKLIETAIEGEFTDVDIVTVPNTPAVMDYEHNALQDIFCNSFSISLLLDYTSKLLDLSAQPFVANYHLSSLNELSQNGRVPYLPGPSGIYGIVYDKELFDQNGWNLPHSLDEFISLCSEIKQEMGEDFRPFQPSLMYSDAVRQFFAGFNYEKLFAGIKNYDWRKSYGEGKVTMEGHMEPGFETLQKLLDNDIIRTTDFKVAPRERSYMLYRDHTCAMTMETQMAPSYAKKYGEGNERKLGMMPFYSGGENADYLLSVPNFYIGASARLAEKGNEEKLAKVMNILGWISSVEGQTAIIDPEMPMISSVKGVSLTGNSFFDGIEETIDKGHIVPQPFLIGNQGTSIDGAFKESLQKWVEGEMTTQEVMTYCDEVRDKVLQDQVVQPNIKIGTALSDFSILETGLYLAQIFKDELKADLALNLVNTRDCGSNIKIYKGDIVVGSSGLSDHTVDGFLDRCFRSTGVENPTRQLQLVTMTGHQILDALNNPPRQYFYPDRYYVAAGLKIEFAPWAGDGKRYVKVELPDETPLELERTYKVAVWNGAVRDEYITSVETTSPSSTAELFTSDVKSRGEIAPFNDGRFTLNWDLISAE